MTSMIASRRAGLGSKHGSDLGECTTYRGQWALQDSNL